MIVHIFIQFVQKCVPRSELFNMLLEVTKKPRLLRRSQLMQAVMSKQQR